jgi:hypothetical protein
MGHLGVMNVIEHSIGEKQLKQDIHEAHLLIMSSITTTGVEAPKSKKIYDKARPQLFTNENSEYMSEMNKDGKTLLSIAGGFDSIIDFYWIGNQRCHGN